MKHHKFHIQYTSPFVCAVALFQILGQNILTYFFFFGIAVLCGSFRDFIHTLKNNKLFFSYLAFIVVVGILDAIFIQLPSTRAIMVWGQFVVLSITLAFFKFKEDLLDATGKFLVLLVVFDFLTNVLLITGHNIPWAEIPPIRPGELFPRLGGLYSNALASGGMTIYLICYCISRTKHSLLIYMLLFIGFINLLFSGSYRYFAILLFLVFIKVFKIFRRGFPLWLATIVFLITMVILTLATEHVGSNEMRIGIWTKTLHRILNDYWGIGIFSANLENVDTASVSILFKAGVTESGILLIGVCFGLIGMFWNFLIYSKTLWETKTTTSLFVLFGLLFTLYSLCFTSFLESSLSIIFNTFGIYIINNQFYESEGEYNHSVL